MIAKQRGMGISGIIAIITAVFVSLCAIGGLVSFIIYYNHNNVVREQTRAEIETLKIEKSQLQDKFADYDVIIVERDKLKAQNETLLSRYNTLKQMYDRAEVQSKNAPDSNRAKPAETERKKAREAEQTARQTQQTRQAQQVTRPSPQAVNNADLKEWEKAWSDLTQEWVKLDKDYKLLIQGLNETIRQLQTQRNRLWANKPPFSEDPNIERIDQTIKSKEKERRNLEHRAIESQENWKKLYMSRKNMDSSQLRSASRIISEYGSVVEKLRKLRQL
jgi:hypothetical protein